MNAELRKSVQFSRQRYQEYLEQKRDEADQEQQKNKRKHEGEIQEMRQKLKELQAEQTKLVAEADEYCVQAEKKRSTSNTMSLIIKSNCLCRRAKEMDVEIDELRKQIEIKRTALAI